MKKILIILLLILLLPINKNVVLADDDTVEQFRVTIKTDGLGYGSLYNEDSLEEGTFFECMVDKADGSMAHYDSRNGNTISIYSSGDVITKITPVQKEGYAFYKWTINEHTDTYYHSFWEDKYLDVEIVAHFAKENTIYWGLDIDDLSNFNYEDRNKKYTLLISNTKDVFKEYEAMKDYVVHYSWGYDSPTPLAGETTGVFKDYPEWANIFGKVNNVEILNDFDVTSISNWFSYYRGDSDGVINIDLSKIHNVVDASFLFNRSSATSINILNFDMSKVKDMSSMFDDCMELTSVNFGENIDTSKVENFSKMFNGDRPLQDLDVSKFNTSSAIYFNNMFAECGELESLDLSSFKTSNVVDMSRMFIGCESLQELDLSGFNTQNVVNFYGMFHNCSSLKTLDLSNFYTPKALLMSYMFADCTQLEYIDVSNFDTSNVTSMSSMFYECRSLKELDLLGFDTSNVTDFSEMFRGVDSIEELDLTSFTLSEDLTWGISYMFAPMLNLKTIYTNDNFDLSHLNNSDIFGWGNGINPPYAYCYQLKGENGSYITPIGEDLWNGIRVEDEQSMYYMDPENCIGPKYARIDDPENGKPGYFTKGYSVTLNFDDGKKKKVTKKLGTEITLPKPEKDYYVFVGWSDGEKIYTDTYTIVKDNEVLTPVWKDDIKIEYYIDDLTYNGKVQNALPSALIDVPEAYFDVSYSQVNSNRDAFNCIQSGEYIAHITLEDIAINEGYVFVLENGDRSYELDINFKIDKCPLNININSFNVFLNNSIPLLTYSSKGLVQGHTINLMLTCDADTKTLGKYPINVDGHVVVYDENKNDVTENYEISINDGVLSVIKYIPYIPPKTGIN